MDNELAMTTITVADALATECAKRKQAYERYALRMAGDLLAEIAHATNIEHSDRLWKTLSTVADGVTEEHNIG